MTMGPVAEIDDPARSRGALMFLKVTGVWRR